MWAKIRLIFSKLWDFIGPTITILSQAAIQEFTPIAIDAVRAAAQYATDNDEKKRDIAVKQIKDAAKAKGKTLADSVINLLIEMALQKVKAQ